MNNLNRGLRIVELQKDGASNENQNSSRRGKSPSSADSIRNLRLLISQLIHEVDALGRVGITDTLADMDFHEEVRQFEIRLITAALLRTRGHQGQAARLLNIKRSTLNDKVRRYNIDSR